MKLSEMTKDERSLLLFLETCAVDHGGLVDLRHMNSDDIAQAKRWDESGFVHFGRICFADQFQNLTHWCELSDEAWRLAHEERRARNARLYGKRSWQKTVEKQGEKQDETV